jgi:putative ABC transport system substrate-binding protein
MMYPRDPIAPGLVPSLARAGGNLTGLTVLALRLAPQRLELLKEMLPRVSQVAVLWSLDEADPLPLIAGTGRAAQALRLRLQSLEIRHPGEIEAAFDAAVVERVHALFVMGQSVIATRRCRVLELAVECHLPEMYGVTESVRAGALMSYAMSPRPISPRGLPRGPHPQGCQSRWTSPSSNPASSTS